MNIKQQFQAFLLASCLTFTVEAFDLTYPATPKIEHVDDYFSQLIADPYQWLENLDDLATQLWIDNQNVFTQSFLTQVPFREQIKARLTELLNYERYSSPCKVGDYLFFSKNDGLQNQNVIYIQKGSEEPKVFLDPNTLSESGTTAINSLIPSHDHRHLAISISKAGSDWETILFMEIASQTFLPDVLERSKFGVISWQGQGIHYCRYIEEISDSGEKFDQQKIYYHILGQPQENDQLVFEDREHPYWFYLTEISAEERYVFLTAHQGAGDPVNGVWYKDLRESTSHFMPLFTDFNYSYEILDEHAGQLLVLTNAEAPNKRLVVVDIAKPAPENWKELIPEREELLQWAHMAGGKLFVSYLKDASSLLYQYDREGHFEKALPIPASSTINEFEGDKQEDTLFYSTCSFTIPSTIYKYKISTGQTEVWKQSKLTFDPENYICKQVFISSKDGTKIPLFIVHKKGLIYDGSNPALLYGYGGFGVCMTPRFNASRILFLEKNGIFVWTVLRGGSEYGRSWHEEGKLFKKQNVFDDFIGAAEYLVENGYTSSNKLAIHGASNGGLLVGACMTQRPDLFKVAIPEVGVLDMLRFHKFTIGYAWTTEYGSSEDPAHFKNLLQYSPLHNIKEGVEYPATLIMTADHDDRVVPSHSFKFAATLQEKGSKHNPALIRIEHDAGHGRGRPLYKYIQEQTDFWSFILQHIGK